MKILEGAELEQANQIEMLTQEYLVNLSRLNNKEGVPNLLDDQYLYYDLEILTPVKNKAVAALKLLGIDVWNPGGDGNG